MKTLPITLVAAVAVIPSILTAQDVVRTGQAQGIYQNVPGWPTYPEGVAIGSLHGDMASDSKGHVYFATGKTIQVFTNEGKYLKDLGGAWGGVHGMKVREQGGEEFLFVAQPAKMAVSKLKLDGTKVWEILGHPRVDGMYPHSSKYKPTDVDVAPDGSVIIADGYGMSLIHVYDKDRKYLKTFGGKGKADGQFNVCHNVLVDARGKTPQLLISDRQNNRLQLYRMDGTFVRTIDAELRQPCAADIHGDLLAVGELGGRMSLYGKDYKLISRLGDEPADRKKGNGTPKEAWKAGALIGVHGTTFDSKGDLYAQEYSRFGRVVKYTKAGSGDSPAAVAVAAKEEPCDVVSDIAAIEAALARVKAGIGKTEESAARVAELQKLNAERNQALAAKKAETRTLISQLTVLAEQLEEANKATGMVQQLSERVSASDAERAALIKEHATMKADCEASHAAVHALRLKVEAMLK